jgi:hypothetical protein
VTGGFAVALILFTTRENFCMARLARIAVAFAAVLMICFAGTGTLSAQESTPVVDLSPNADECTREARTVEELQAIYGDPAAEGAGEATSMAMNATPGVDTLPVGTPADEATVEAVTLQIRQQFACFNAGDHLRGFAGVTDEFLISQVGLALFDEDFVAMLEGEPVALSEEEQTQLHGVRDVVVYEDGRVGALVDYMAGMGPEEGIEGFETDLWIFENVDGTWLLDEVYQNLEGLFGPDSE